MKGGRESASPEVGFDTEWVATDGARSSVVLSPVGTCGEEKSLDNDEGTGSEDKG